MTTIVCGNIGGTRTLPRRMGESLSMFLKTKVRFLVGVIESQPRFLNMSGALTDRLDSNPSYRRPVFKSLDIGVLGSFGPKIFSYRAASQVVCWAKCPRR
jgi:hypothetical protein